LIWVSSISTYLCSFNLFLIAVIWASSALYIEPAEKRDHLGVWFLVRLLLRIWFV
jgi:hypothetical protein